MLIKIIKHSLWRTSRKDNSICKEFKTLEDFFEYCKQIKYEVVTQNSGEILILDEPWEDYHS